jgi:hypothetical protein
MEHTLLPLLRQLPRQLLADLRYLLYWGWQTMRHPRENGRYIVAHLPSWLSYAANTKVDDTTQNRTIPWQLVRFFLISRVVFLILGVHMQAQQIPLSMQLMDVSLIQNAFWENLWYMHAQPPLYNVLSWLVVSLAPFGIYGLIAWPLFVLMGLGMCLALYFIQLRLGVPAYWAAGVSFLFSISSNTILYENYFLYAYPATVSLVFAVWFLLRFLDSRSFRDASGLFICVTLPGLLHSFFHLIFPIGVLLGMLLFIRRGWLTVLLAALLPLLAITGWYTKVYVQTGHFAASTWGGWTLSNIMVYFPIPHAEKEQLIAQGVLTEIALYKPFSPPAAYPVAWWKHPPTGIPLLDEITKANGLPNYQNLGTVNISTQAGQNALQILRHAPEYYLHGIQSAAYIFMLAPSEWFYTYSKTLIFYWDWAWSFTTTGKLNWTPPSQSQLLRQNPDYAGNLPTFLGYIPYNGWYNFPWFTPFILAGLIGGGLWLAIRATRRRDPHTLVYWSLLYIIVYVTAGCLLLDIGENQRYRYYMSPQLAVLFGLLSFRWAQSWFSRPSRTDF